MTSFAKEYGDLVLNLMNKGQIVRLHIFKCSMTSALKTESLGLKFKDKDTKKFIKDHIELGRKKIFPSQITNEFADIETELEEPGVEAAWGSLGHGLGVGA